MADDAARPVSPTSRPRRWPRRLAITGLILLALVVLIVALTPWISDLIARPRLESELAKALGVPVRVERAAFSWFGGLDVRGVRIGNVPGGDAGDLLTIDGITGDVRLPALLRGRVILREDLVIAAPRLRLVLHADGGSNIADLIARLPRPPADAPTAPGSGSAPTRSPGADGRAQPLPVIVGSLVAKDLSAVVVDAQGRESVVPPMTLTAKADTSARPVALDVATADGTFTLAARLAVDADGRIDPARLAGSLTYHLDPALSASLRPLLAIVPGVRDCEATVAGDGQLTMDGPMAVGGSGTLTVAVERATLIRAGADGVPTATTVRPGTAVATFSVRTVAAGGLDAAISIESPFARAAVTIVGRRTGEANKLTVDLPMTLRLAELDQRFPGLLSTPPEGALVGEVTAKLAATIAGTGDTGFGDLTVDAAGSGIGRRGADGTIASPLARPRLAVRAGLSNEGGRYEANGLSLALSDADPASAAGDPIVTLRADRIAVEPRSGTYRATGLAVILPGATLAIDGGLAMPGASAEAALEPVTIAGRVDLSPLLDAAGRWAELLGVKLPITGDGSITLAAKADGTLRDLHLRDGLIQAKDLRLSGLGLEQRVAWPLSASLALDLRCAPLALMTSPLEIAQLRLLAPGIDCRCEQTSLIAGDVLATIGRLLDPNAPLAQDAPLSLRMDAQVIPATVLATLPGLADQRIEVAADATATVTMRLEGTTLVPRFTLDGSLPAFTCAIAGATPTGKPGTIAISPTTIAVAVGIDAGTGSISADRLTITNDLVTVEGTAQATRSPTPGAGLSALSAKLGGSADLDRVVALGRALGLVPATTTLAGDGLTWSIDASTAADGIPVALGLTIPGCVYRDASIDLPRQDVAVAVRATVREGGAVVVIDPGSTITATTLQATLHGAIRGLPARPSADQLVVELTYAPATLNPLLGAVGGGQLNGEAAQSSRLSLSGPLLAGDAQPLDWLADLDSHDTSIAFASWSKAGFTVAGPPLPLRLADGKLDLAYACTVNDGPADVRIAASLPDEHADFAVTTSDLRLTNDLAWLVGYVNPIFHLEEQGTLAGTASATVTGAWQGPFMPADLRQALGTSLVADLRFSAAQVSITGSKLLLAIVNELSAGAANDLVEVSPTDVAVRGGVASYRDMQVRVGAIPLVFAGTANLVTDALDMTMVAPFPLAKASAKLEKFLPKTLTLRIRGTISEPRYDFAGAVRTALKDAAEQAAKELLGGQAGAVLDDLLKKKR